MTRLCIDRVVIEADFADPRDSDTLRERIEHELTQLIASAGLPERVESRTRVQGGELPSSPGSMLPRLIAERVVRSLGGKS